MQGLYVFCGELDDISDSEASRTLKLTLLGHTISVRIVGEHSYIYEPTIARRDRGRPCLPPPGVVPALAEAAVTFQP